MRGFGGALFATSIPGGLGVGFRDRQRSTERDSTERSPNVSRRSPNGTWTPREMFMGETPKTTLAPQANERGFNTP
jgi:hypothetical protein